MISFKKETPITKKYFAPKLEVLIGYEVKAQRQRRDMSIVDLAKYSGLSPSMISRIENGSTSASLTTLQMSSKTFSVPIRTFFAVLRNYAMCVHTAHKNVSS